MTQDITPQTHQKIKNFWNWFQDNEVHIKNALMFGINRNEVFFHLNRNLNYISKRIGFMMTGSSESSNKCTIIFTAYGYSKLFPKIVALEDHAVHLQYFIPQAFIKPMKDISIFQNSSDKPRIYENFEIKISRLQMTLIDYDITTKQMKIKVYLPNYDEVKQFDNLLLEIEFIVMETIGEIAFKKHIKKIELAQSPQYKSGLLNLVELPFFIDYLCTINSRVKLRIL